MKVYSRGDNGEILMHSDTYLGEDYVSPNLMHYKYIRKERKNDRWYYIYDELYHYGILGQKWGVRRYQNPDGSLTRLGKKRLGKSIESLKARDQFLDSVYNIKNKKARSELIKELKYEPGETDTVTSFNKYHKNKISKKEMNSILKSMERINNVYKARGVKELKKIFKDIKKGDKIMSKYNIHYDKPSITTRKFISEEEMKDFYDLYREAR